MARPGADLFVVLGISTSEEGNQHAPEFPSLLYFSNRDLPYMSSYVRYCWNIFSCSMRHVLS